MLALGIVGLALSLLALLVGYLVYLRCVNATEDLARRVEGLRTHAESLLFLLALKSILSVEERNRIRGWASAVAVTDEPARWPELASKFEAIHGRDGLEEALATLQQLLEGKR